MKRFLTFCAPAAALIAEFLPWGVQMNFANPEGPPFTELCSYFDLLPVGYGNLFPMLVSILTCILILDLSFYGVRGTRPPLIVGLVLSALAAVCSGFQLAFSPVTVIGILILLFMAGQMVYLSILLKNFNKKTAD